MSDDFQKALAQASVQGIGDRIRVAGVGSEDAQMYTNRNQSILVTKDKQVTTVQIDGNGDGKFGGQHDISLTDNGRGRAFLKEGAREVVMGGISLDLNHVPLNELGDMTRKVASATKPTTDKEVNGR